MWVSEKFTSPKRSELQSFKVSTEPLNVSASLSKLKIK